MLQFIIVMSLTLDEGENVENKKGRENMPWADHLILLYKVVGYL
jgi:hypothetical protein